MPQTAALTPYTATARHITTVRLGGAVHLHDENTGHTIGQADIIRGFAHYFGARGSAHEGITLVIGGGLEGLRAALRDGVRNGRDDRDA